MRVRRLLLRGFGCLRGEYHFAGDRVNLVLEPNESGKSTLASAVLVGLYGFPPGQRRSESRPVPESEIYRPWSAAEYLVEVDVEADGRVYTVRRDFAKKDERVYEWRTGKDITADFQSAKDVMDFGGKITGLDREDFARTVFLRQTEMRELRNAAGITAALQRMATSQQGDVAAAEAIDILKESLRQFRGSKIRRGKIENEITGVSEEIAVLAERLRSMEERRREAENRIRELEDTSRHEGRVDSDLQRIEYLVLAAGRREDAVRLEQETRERQDLEERETEFQPLTASAGIPTDGLSRLLELKGRLQALTEEEERLQTRAEEEIEAPLRALEGRALAAEALSALTASDLSRFSAAETDLAAAWKAKVESRRAQRSLRAGWRGSVADFERIRSLSERFAALGPDERRFLLACGEQHVAARSSAAEMERDAERVASALAEVEGRTGRTRSLRRALAAGGAASLVAAAALFLLSQTPAWAYGAAAAGAAAFVVLLALKPGGAADAKIASLRAEEDAVARALADKTQEAASIASRLESLAGRTGFDSGERLLTEFREAETHQEEAAEHAAIQRRTAQAAAAFRAGAAAVGDVMEAARHTPRFGAVTPRTARAFRALAAAHRETLSRIEDLRERRRGPEQQVARLAQERAAIRRDVDAVLEAAGLESVEDLDRAAALLEEGLARRERYETLKREIIPALVRRSMSHQGESLRRAVEVADAVLRRKTQEDPSLADRAPEMSHKEYVEERDRLRQQSRSLAERRMELSSDLGEVLREYRKEFPDTERWMREWQDLRDRTLAFKAAVELACEVLDGISREAYAEWADVLNDRASSALSQVVPGYGDLRFDEDLSFTVREASDGSRRSREDVDHRLSAGTRDQIYLAARLAMADYLSAGRVKLPLILDDPFATFDDDRFARAMEMLVDKFSRRHQIVIFTCHEARHRAWQERNPERFAERVRVMSLQTPVP